MRDRRLLFSFDLIGLASCWSIPGTGSDGRVAHARNHRGRGRTPVSGSEPVSFSWISRDQQERQLHSRSCSERLQGLGRWQGTAITSFSFQEDGFRR